MQKLLALIVLSLAGCAGTPQRAAPDTDFVLLGEQHDAPSHQRWHRAIVADLAREGRLAAVALEMAEQGTSTQRVAADADASSVQAALRWNEEAWPWAAYGPAIMTAVRAGIPVAGANLPRTRMRDAMQNEALDAALPAAALRAQQDAVREGHCGLLPPAQVPAMTRVQVARDIAMANTMASLRVPGKTVVLIAGAGHVDPALGVPVHLPRNLRSQSIAWPAAAPQRDYCAQLRKQGFPSP